MKKTVLYKYLTVERAIQVISSQNIRFTQQSFLNDAFELMPTFDIDKIIDKYRKENILKNLNDLQKVTLGLTDSLLHLAENRGILCLSRNFDIPLMWAHYCGNYTGVVIGFDADEGLLPEDKRYNVGDINYSRKRFVYPNSDPDADFMYHKDVCWEYEKEYRIVRPLDNLIHIKDDIYVSSFNPQAIRCVIYGPLISLEARNSIYDILRRKEYSHVVQYVSYLDDSSFEIDIDYLSSTFSDESSMIYNEKELRVRSYHDNMISKGRLFKAMGIIPSDREFRTFKEQVDLYTGKLFEE